MEPKSRESIKYRTSCSISISIIYLGRFVGLSILSLTLRSGEMSFNLKENSNFNMKSEVSFASSQTWTQRLQLTVMHRDNKPASVQDLTPEELRRLIH